MGNLSDLGNIELQKQQFIGVLTSSYSENIVICHWKHPARDAIFY